MAASLDYFHLLKEFRRKSPAAAGTPLRVALFGDCATQQLASLLSVLLRRKGLEPHLYEGGFDTVRTEALDPGSGLYAFDPQFVLLVFSTQAFRSRFHASADRRALVEEMVDEWRDLWSALRERTSARIVQSTLAVPVERWFGSFEARVEESLASTVATLNRRLLEEAARHDVLLFDVDYVASWVGKRSFFDEKLWTLAKTPCALEHLPRVAQAAVDVMAAARGAGVKCVVLDLDDTLWGGVIGDDGLEGIELGHLGAGEAFVALQHYLRELTRRGILLAVCSKNDLANALLPFREHPEMVLREQDITVFVANWENKAQNIAGIKETLSIGYDSMVFLDDNPFERNLVRELLPEVIVPEMPADPADWVKALSELNLFETTSFTDADRRRRDLYQAAADRDRSRRSFTNINDYLRSLEMRVSLRRFSPEQLPRIAQLMQRSNQFNLCTRRFSESQCAAFMKDESYFPFSVSLSDRYGDHGLISAVVTHVEGSALQVDEYVMSCRVLQRGVENYAMNALVAWASERGLREVRGTYLPTAKNGMVRDFFPRFGFACVGEEEGGARHFCLEVARYQPQPALMSPLEER